MQKPSPATDSVTRASVLPNSIAPKNAATPMLAPSISRFCGTLAESAAHTSLPTKITAHSSVAMVWL